MKLSGISPRFRGMTRRDLLGGGLGSVTGLLVGGVADTIVTSRKKKHRGYVPLGIFAYALAAFGFFMGKHFFNNRPKR